MKGALICKEEITCSKNIRFYYPLQYCMCITTREEEEKKNKKSMKYI